MPRAKRYSAEQIVAKLRQHEKLQAQGLTIPQACKRIGISDQTFYRWRIKYGALKEGEAQRLKALEQENSRLKRIVADQALDISMLKDLEKGECEPCPETRRRGIPAPPSPSLRAPGVPSGRPAPLHPALPLDRARLPAAARSADERARGAPSPLRLPPHLGPAARRGLGGKQKAHRAPLARGGPSRPAAEKDAPKEGPGHERERLLEPRRRPPESDLVLRLPRHAHPKRLSGEDPQRRRRVHPALRRHPSRALDRRWRCHRGADQALRDTGPTRDLALGQRARVHGRVGPRVARWRGSPAGLHRPRQPAAEPILERFNGTTRDEVLNGETFRSLLEARVVVGAWVDEYNDIRPHRGLGMKTPRAFYEEGKVGSA